MAKQQPINLTQLSSYHQQEQASATALAFFCVMTPLILKGINQ